MLKTFRYRAEAKENRYEHTVYSVDVLTSVEKWINRIEDLQNEVYSFSAPQVQLIKEQFQTGHLKIYTDKKPWFLTYRDGEKLQVVQIDEINKGEPDFIAKVYYLSTEQGGRSRYAVSGYRPHVKFDGRKELTSGEQLFVDKDKVYPGDTSVAEIRILGVEVFRNYLYPGLKFEVSEGPRLVGKGEVLEVVNPQLRRSSS